MSRTHGFAESVISLEDLVEKSAGTAAPDRWRGRRVEGRHLADVDADRSMMRVVILNLVGNAMKYCRSHACADRDWSRGTDDEVVMFVRDNGVGFDMQYADKLFGVFQRLHAKNGSRVTGSAWPMSTESSSGMAVAPGRRVLLGGARRSGSPFLEAWRLRIESKRRHYCGIETWRSENSRPPAGSPEPLFLDRMPRAGSAPSYFQKWCRGFLKAPLQLCPTPTDPKP